MALENVFGELALEETLHARFGVVIGEPVIVNSTGPTTLATPDSGMSVRLKWVGFALDADTASSILTIQWSDGTIIYKWPVGRIPAFAHGSVREAPDIDIVLEAVLTGGTENVYVNLDWENF